MVMKSRSLGNSLLSSYSSFSSCNSLLKASASALKVSSYFESGWVLNQSQSQSQRPLHTYRCFASSNASSHLHNSSGSGAGSSASHTNNNSNKVGGSHHNNNTNIVHHNSIKLSTIPTRIKHQIIRENPSGLNHQEGSRTRFKWDGVPKTVLIVKKHKDKRITLWLNTIATWLKQTYNIRVLIEPNVASELSHIESYTEEESHLLGKVVDFVITLGGDGTLLHVSSLFKEDVPPIISFHLGTLGFLMPFNVEDYQEALDNVIKGDFLCTNRMRLMCDVYHKQQIGTNTPSRSFQVLNEVTIHRGSSPHSTVINCTVNGHMLTDIVGDGLIVASATGSTAYSLSCGGPMVHPCINCILITPIAPSSLSSKPALLPDDSVLKLNIGPKGKSFTTTFDGTRSIKMEQGEHIIIRKSHYPLLTINKTNETTDWVHGNGKLIEMSEKSSIWNQRVHTTSAN